MELNMGIAQLEKEIREKYKQLSSMHISLLVDIMLLIKQSVNKRRTYIDALDLLNLAERNLRASYPVHDKGCASIDDHHVTDGITFKPCDCRLANAKTE